MAAKKTRINGKSIHNKLVLHSHTHTHTQVARRFQNHQLKARSLPCFRLPSYLINVFIRRVSRNLRLKSSAGRRLSGGEKQVVREPGAAGREDPRRPKATRTLLGEDVERPPPAFLCPHPVPGKRGPPTCHLGGSRSQAQRTAWAPERAGDRRAGTPGGCRNCSPGARSIGWGGRQRLAPTGWPAGIDTHPHPAQARA